ncbi:MAG: ParB/RepB/Spo0J family partition protein [Longimonas sp.]|uniref:ParB/RepB/Spo0J family partition protein n=1 Tax=Longimonas sp. TaxID=2039626 RepID=UPI003356FC39
MANKSALGRGLNALLPADDENDASSDSGTVRRSKLYQFEDDNEKKLIGRVADVAIEAIRPNPYQPRQSFSEDALDELAASIEQLGIIQPITVRALGDDQFEIISGERRWRAARRTDLTHLPAFVRSADSEQMLEMALVENVQREELNPIEIALGYHRLMDEVGLTQAEVAEKVGKGRATVANFLRLLRLPPRIQAALRDGEVAMGHARALVSLDDPEAQRTLIDEVISDDLSVRDVEQRVRDWRAAQEESERASESDTPADPSPSSPDRTELQVEDYRKRLRSRLSTQVRIHHKNDGEGRIEIAYYSEDDLERLLDLLDA